MESHIYNESQRKLVELAYYLPLGSGAEYFYTMMVLLSHNDGVEMLLPKKQQKDFADCMKATEQYKAKNKKNLINNRYRKTA